MRNQSFSVVLYLFVLLFRPNCKLKIFLFVGCRQHFMFAGQNRLKMGLPGSWAPIRRWLNRHSPVYTPPQPRPPTANMKCPELPILRSYKITPPASFWSKFPSRPLPTKPSTPVNVPVLQSLIKTHESSFPAAQRILAEKVLNELTHGVDALQTSRLPGAIVPNSGSVLEHGPTFTDVVAHWIKKGFVAGPFSAPPCADFRANSMIAVSQKEKIRIIMNLSAPEGESFNDAVDSHELQKVYMSTAKNFGYTVIDCGSKARMWKFDLSDAYKNLPAKTADLRQQGFQWLQAFFVETQQAFGARTAVAAFDRLGNLILLIALTISGKRLLLIA